MCRFYHTSNTTNRVSATKYTAFWVIEYCIFVKDLVDCSAKTHGVIFAKYVAQITKQQGRYAVGHRVLHFQIVGRVPPDLGQFCDLCGRHISVLYNLKSRAGFWANRR